MQFWQKVFSPFSPANKPALHLAILTCDSSGTNETYINLTIKQLRPLLAHQLVATQFSGIGDEKKFALFARHAKQHHFDAILAIDSTPAMQARRMYTEHGLFIPTLLIAANELLPHPMPHHISGLLPANNAHLTFRLLTTCMPELKTLLICAQKSALEKSEEIHDLQKLFTTHGTRVIAIDLDQPLSQINQQITAHDPVTSVLYMSYDARAFHAMPDVISFAHKHRCTTIASDLLAINYGTDLAVGYPAEAIAQETAQQLMCMIKRPHRTFRIFKTTQEIHCHATKTSSWLKALSHETHNYHFKIIGGAGNAQSAQAQPATQER